VDRVILLNNDYQYLHSIGWKKAMALIVKGKAEVLKYADRVIRTAEGVVYKLPIVMRLVKFVRTIFKTHVPFSKSNVLIRDGQICQYCGTSKSDGNHLTIDHVVPKSKGGKTNFENCVAACKRCNVKKQDRLPSEAKMYPKRAPHQPTIMEFLNLRANVLGINNLIREVIG
jgi:Restriction endonuclease